MNAPLLFPQALALLEKAKARFAFTHGTGPGAHRALALLEVLASAASVRRALPGANLSAAERQRCVDALEEIDALADDAARRFVTDEPERVDA